MKTSIPAWARGLEQQTALVTGASRGIGHCCAKTLAQAGAQVIAVARSIEGLNTLAEEFPGQIECWVEDINNVSFLERIEALPQLNILVNNVGTNDPKPMIETSTASLDKVLNLNVRAAFLTAQAAVKVMLKYNTRGSIIHMSSQMGHVGSPNRTVYCMTKHAIEGLSKAMAVELAPQGIRVNTVAPTFIDTPLTKPMFDNPEFKDFVMSRIPMGQLGEQQDVANAVLFLASNASKMITGDSLKVDGGWTAQ